MKKLFLGSCLAGALVSCGPPVPSDPDLTCDASPPAVSLATDIQPLFQARCGTCHVANYSYGDYSTAAKTGAIVGKKSLYAGMAASLAVVDAQSLANSALWLKVLGGATSGRTGPKGENVYGKMPNDPSITLTAEEQKQIKDWICGGAQ